MRIKIYANNGYGSVSSTRAGGTMLGPLILAADPLVDLEAATKQYVDSKISNFNASNFNSGTLQSGRLPAFGGDVISSTGSSSLSLVDIGISSGVYTKVTVNSKGLVTSGSSVGLSDIASIDWGRIAYNKPTTLDGYGITNAVSLNGGAITNALTLHADPTSGLHIASKQYVDNKSSTVSCLNVGDIITKGTSVTPTGFFKCNGGELRADSYAGLYSVLGSKFGGRTDGSSNVYFNLPDLSAAEITGSYAYIKY